MTPPLHWRQSTNHSDRTCPRLVLECEQRPYFQTDLRISILSTMCLPPPIEPNTQINALSCPGTNILNLRARPPACNGTNPYSRRSRSRIQGIDVKMSRLPRKTARVSGVCRL
eukprot:3824997-Rhodomonas_salina.1